MAGWTHAFLPTQQVLVNNGEIGFSELARKLMEMDPFRFRDEKQVESILDNSCNCLVYGGGVVRFDRTATKYTKNWDSDMERSIQFALHEAVPDMEKWQLYPLKTKKNSQKCYLGIPWEEIPEDPMPPKSREGEPPSYYSFCDFRTEGKDSCKIGCRVSEEILRKYNLI